jgi:hypothetical protein
MDSDKCEDTMDSIEEFLSEFGCKYVVFQEAVGFPHPETGLPIKRETALKPESLLRLQME